MDCAFSSYGDCFTADTQNGSELFCGSYSVATFIRCEKFGKQLKNPVDCHTSVRTGSQ